MLFVSSSQFKQPQRLRLKTIETVSEQQQREQAVAAGVASEKQREPEGEREQAVIATAAKP